MLGKCSGAFKQLRTFKRAVDLAHGLVNCMGRCTVTGMLTASGQQFRDWSAAYRLFEGDRMDVARIFSAIRREAVASPGSGDGHIYAHMDDTNIRKRGKKVFGTSWQRDPLGPPFHTNFIWGQRFIQISLSLFGGEGPSQSRAVPVDFHHCPPVRKPKKGSPDEDWKVYKETQKKAKLSTVGAERVRLLRKNLDGEGCEKRVLVLSVDGSYTNETVIKKLPENVTLIGRIRKDCKLNGLPAQKTGSPGRALVYGPALPTPEQVRQSEEYKWTEVRAWAAGKVHTFNVKIIRGVRWRKAGKMDLQLIVIRPVGYRLTKNSKVLYRDPAYLICTDSAMETEKLLQAYLWRWEIEVNFRDQKTLLGCGQAQVRNQQPCEKVPAFVTAVYAMLLLAAYRVKNKMLEEQLPRPKWYAIKKSMRITTGDLINNFRAIKWADGLKINFSNFVKLQSSQRNRKNYENPTLSGLLYQRN